MIRLYLWLVTAISLAVPSVAWAQQQCGPGYGPHMMWNGGSWVFFGPLLLMIAFIAVIVAVVERLALKERWNGEAEPTAALPNHRLGARLRA